MMRLIHKALRWARSLDASKDRAVRGAQVEGYYAGPGVGPFAVPVDRDETLHDGYEPIRRRRPGELNPGLE
jgi:hypothetical protein